MLTKQPDTLTPCALSKRPVYFQARHISGEPCALVGMPDQACLGHWLQINRMLRKAGM